MNNKELLKKNINKNKDVETLFNIFKEAKEELYLVGGAIRNTLLNVSINDFDFSTNLKPDEVIKLAKKNNLDCIPTGITFGTVTIVMNNSQFEITTYRKDSDSSDGRKPEYITYSESLEEDLKRRDFTINALAYNPEKGIIDLFNGVEDIKAGVIRTVGNPDRRFTEDALRILRGVRFSAKYNLAIEEKTLQAMKDNINNLHSLSAERVLEEFSEIITLKNPSIGLNLLYEIGFFKELFPTIHQMKGFHQHNHHHDKDLWDHTIAVIDNTPDVLSVRIAALLHDVGKIKTQSFQNGEARYFDHNKVSSEYAKTFNKKVNLDNKTSKLIENLVYYHMLDVKNVKRKGTIKFINIFNKNLSLFLSLLKADRLASAPNYQDIKDIENWTEEIREIFEEKQAISLKDMKINGDTLMELGCKQGPEIGVILNNLFEIIIEKPELNNAEHLRKLALEMIQK